MACLNQQQVQVGENNNVYYFKGIEEKGTGVSGKYFRYASNGTIWNKMGGTYNPFDPNKPDDKPVVNPTDPVNPYPDPNPNPYAPDPYAIYITTINNSFISIGNVLGGLEESVWRNAEGKFNTSRLLSDSIAGVVLGTTGGLVTSSLVKKNQIEEGFENVQCTIGGQTVANYGDEFVVGMTGY